MTAKHVRAVQKLRRNFDNALDYELLCIIACDVGINNEPARTSYRGMAERSACHRNTIPNHIENLKNGGWINIIKDGKFHRYTLNISDTGNEIETGKHPQLAQSQSCELCQLHEDRLAQLEDRLAQLEDRLAQLEDRLAQNMGITGTANQIDNVPEDRRYNRSNNIYIAPLAQPIVEMITALTQVSKTPYGAGFNEKEYENAALIMIGKDLSPDKLLEVFPTWWDGNGFHPGKPTLSIVLQEIDNALLGVSTKQLRGNGNGSQEPAFADPSWPKPNEGGRW